MSKQRTEDKYIEQLIADKEILLKKKGYLEFSDEDINRLLDRGTQIVKEYFHGRAMMKLPEKEIRFFKWLKKHDPSVWADLWDEEEEPYLVSIDFLHHFTENGNGFPICDLIDQDNYWFNAKHIKPGGIELLELMSEKTEQKQPLSFEEGLLAEVSRGSIDIWHFCYKYNLPLSVAKRKVETMHREDILVHLTNRDDLLKYLDI